MRNDSPELDENSEEYQHYLQFRKKSILSTPQNQAEQGGLLPGGAWNKSSWDDAKKRWRNEAKQLGVDIEPAIEKAEKYLLENNKLKNE